MNYKILSLKDKQEWNKYFELLPIEQQDVYYTPEYYQLYEDKGDGQAECFVYLLDGKLVLYPYLTNSVNKLGYTLDEEYYDIQGCYGLNGPISNTSDSEFIYRFQNEFNEMCKKRNIITEFTRFNPLLRNNVLFRDNEVIHVGDTVNIRLDIDINEIWLKSYSRDIRRIINKGKELGYVAELKLLSEANEDEFDQFIKIYFSTLNRNNAEEFYYFDKDFLFNMKEKMGGNVLFGIIYFEGKAIASSINPFKGVNGYGFLGGSYREYQKVSPFTFMMNCVIGKLQDLGICNYFLGGGEDSILKYKKSFNKNDLRKFYIRKKIHNRDVYDNVIEQWEKNNKFKDNNKLLKYREIR